MPANTVPRQLTELGKKNLEDYIKLAVTSTLDQSLDFARNTPAFIADTSPVIPAYSAARAVARQACRQWSRGQGIPSLPGFDAAWGGLCKPYLEGIGENPPDGSIAPNFTGGQCPGVLYRAVGDIQFDFFNCSTGFRSVSSVQATTEFRLVGPVSGPNISFDTPGPCGNRRILWTWNTGNGIASGGSLLNSLSFASLSGGQFVGTMQPVPGGANNCGDPESLYDPPSIPTGLPPLAPVTVNVPGIGPVDLDVSFNPDGSINVGLPDLGIDVTIPNPFAVDGEDSGGEGGGAGDTTNPGAPGGGGDTGSGGEAEGEAEDGEELVGLLVEVLGTPPGANVFDNNSATVYRGVGYVRMGYPGRLGVDISGGTVLSPQFFHAQQRGLTAWAVNANLGYNIRTTPYYRDIVS